MSSPARTASGRWNVVLHLSCTLEEAELLLKLTGAIQESIERVHDDALTCAYHEQATADALKERQWALDLQEPSPL